MPFGVILKYLFGTNLLQFGTIVHIQLGVKAHGGLEDCSVKWDVLETFPVSL